MNLVSLGGKYSGIFTQKKESGVTSYYIKFKDEKNISRRLKVGESPEMTKTKAKMLLFNKQQDVAKIKRIMNGDQPNSQTILTRRIIKNSDNSGQAITLNYLADFYFKQHGSRLKNLSSDITRYDYHLRNESLAQKPLHLITRDDIGDFLERKMEQRADRRSRIKNDKTLEEKELIEYQSNLDIITKLESVISLNPDRDNWREKNKVRYFKEKNRILALRASPTASEKLLNNKSIPASDKRSLLGLLSMKSIKEILLFAVTIVNYAIWAKDLKIKNPFSIPRHSSRFKIKVDNIRDRYLTKEEIIDYLNEVKLISKNEKHNNIYLMSLFALSFAGRQNTILTIKISDIDFQSGTIQLRNHKTEKWYSGSIGDDIIKDEMIRVIGNRDPNEYLFINYMGQRPKQYPRVMQDVLDYTVNYKKDYLTWLSLKDFRNTAASHMAMAGIPLIYISKVLNHSSIVMTERYAHLLPESSESIKTLVASYNLKKYK